MLDNGVISIIIQTVSTGKLLAKGQAKNIWIASDNGFIFDKGDQR